MYKISIQVFIRVDLHKKFHPILIIWSWDIELWKLAKLKTFLQFRWSSKLYISAATDQNWVNFFVQIDPNENLDWYFIHLGQIWLPLCLRVITKCMNLQSGVWIYKSWRYRQQLRNYVLRSESTNWGFPLFFQYYCLLFYALQTETHMNDDNWSNCPFKSWLGWTLIAVCPRSGQF